jgi:hypothetical protein
MGGQNVLGPVTDWGTQYYMSDSVTAATPGQVSLVATERNYSAWVRHVVDNDPGIKGGAQGLMPADIDGDRAMDLVAHSNGNVFWYKNVGNYDFLKCLIGPAANGTYFWSCVCPCDLDKDGDDDVLVATKVIGVGWYENENLSWTWHSLDNTRGYQMVSASDVELDGDIDIIAVDNNSSSPNYVWGDIHLFRNDGADSFFNEIAVDLPDKQGWRTRTADFSGDGYPDIYCSHSDVSVFINDSTGSFIQSFFRNHWSEADADGMWPSDIDMDGDLDVIYGGKVTSTVVGFNALLNDSTGQNFQHTILQGTQHGSQHTYSDGAIACDMDLDGLPDIVGTCYRVGYYRQDPSNPLTFSLYDIGALGNSHWVYASPLGRMCLPSIDLLVTDDGGHIVYENQMLLDFANLGWLESSVFRLARVCSLRHFGYEVCAPSDTAIAFYWRDGTSMGDILSKPWSGPEYASLGMVSRDSFPVGPKTASMFQYKVEFRKGPDDIGVLYEIWFAYDCRSTGTEEVDTALSDKPDLRFSNGDIILSLTGDEAISLIVYDAAGRFVNELFRGKLSQGMHKFSISGKPGIYFAKLESGMSKKTLKFTKLK